jgi:hypothetical protein
MNLIFVIYFIVNDSVVFIIGHPRADNGGFMGCIASVEIDPDRGLNVSVDNNLNLCRASKMNRQIQMSSDGTGE